MRRSVRNQRIQFPCKGFIGELCTSRIAARFWNIVSRSSFPIENLSCSGRMEFNAAPRIRFLKGGLKGLGNALMIGGMTAGVSTAGGTLFISGALCIMVSNTIRWNWKAGESQLQMSDEAALSSLVSIVGSAMGGAAGSFARETFQVAMQATITLGQALIVGSASGAASGAIHAFGSGIRYHPGGRYRCYRFKFWKTFKSIVMTALIGAAGGGMGVKFYERPLLGFMPWHTGGFIKKILSQFGSSNMGQRGEISLHSGIQSNAIPGLAPGGFIGVVSSGFAGMLDIDLKHLANRSLKKGFSVERRSDGNSIIILRLLNALLARLYGKSHPLGQQTYCMAGRTLKGNTILYDRKRHLYTRQSPVTFLWNDGVRLNDLMLGISSSDVIEELSQPGMPDLALPEYKQIFLCTWPDHLKRRSICFSSNCKSRKMNARKLVKTMAITHGLTEPEAFLLLKRSNPGVDNYNKLQRMMDRTSIRFPDECCWIDGGVSLEVYCLVDLGLLNIGGDRRVGMVCSDNGDEYGYLDLNTELAELIEQATGAPLWGRRSHP